MCCQIGLVLHSVPVFSKQFFMGEGEVGQGIALDNLLESLALLRSLCRLGALFIQNRFPSSIGKHDWMHVRIELNQIINIIPFMK